jgi:hypothetical protein
MILCRHEADVLIREIPLAHVRVSPGVGRCCDYGVSPGNNLPPVSRMMADLLIGQPQPLQALRDQRPAFGTNGSGTCCGSVPALLVQIPCCFVASCAQAMPSA